ncbi:hypothetical protein G7062_05175 [Erysipelothrix sp. HDW6C]|uniref:hypothetical protein n=1 Tax=Erysipelothrix sp. HDW6C TaxID=2714930 RepID=UPI00140B56B8|nr:hypothetical protein [Erysipelothrix sp. HDW6C]QIK69723.1 hypothetical protein G7062_05175 [Erysipelothrix sp. HDW6C]
MKENNVYIVLSDTGSMLTRAIQLYTKSPYNHVSISFDETLNSLYSFGRKSPRNPFIGGFVEESFYGGTFKRFKETRCLVLKLSVDDETVNILKEKVGAFVANKDDYHYDFIGLLAYLFKKRVIRQNHYYCTEFVAEVMAEADMYCWELPPHLVTPQDFTQIDNSEVVYEGLLKEFGKA